MNRSTLRNKLIREIARCYLADRLYPSDDPWLPLIQPRPLPYPWVWERFVRDVCSAVDERKFPKRLNKDLCESRYDGSSPVVLHIARDAGLLLR